MYNKGFIQHTAATSIFMKVLYCNLKQNECMHTVCAVVQLELISSEIVMKTIFHQSCAYRLAVVC
jgi:hypothetical protein